MKRLGLRRRFGRGRKDQEPAPEPVQPPKQKSKPKPDAPDPKEGEETHPLPPLSRDKEIAGLNAKQGLFVRHYVKTNNATKSAIAAGYSEDSAPQIGSRLLRNAKVAAEISRRRDKILQKLDLTPERVIEELGRVALSNMGNYMRTGADGEPVLDFSDLNKDQTAALQEVTVEEFVDGRSDKRQVRRVKFKLGDKVAALGLLAKHYALLVEKHDHRHTHTVIGVLLDEIDQIGRSARLIEHMPANQDGGGGDGVGSSK